VELCAGQVRALADELVTSTAAQRRALPGMPARRVASIGYGAAVLDAVVSELGVGHLVVSEWGLREGTVLELAGAARRGARTGADASPAALRPGR
jgi:exopolyphosphatase/pppGpp-phosphohydrolase